MKITHIAIHFLSWSAIIGWRDCRAVMTSQINLILHPNKNWDNINISINRYKLKSFSWKSSSVFSIFFFTFQYFWESETKSYKRITFPLTYMHVSFSKTKFFPLKPPSQELSHFTVYTVNSQCGILLQSRYTLITSHNWCPKKKYRKLKLINQSPIYCSDVHFWHNNMMKESDTMEIRDFLIRNFLREFVC